MSGGKAYGDSIAPEHAMCRVFAHAWRYTTVDREGKVFVQWLGCTRCEAQRYVKIDADDGEIVSTGYRYPEGYLIRGGVDHDARARLRLSQVAGNAKRSRRKRT